jgi:hypothetical protein
MCEGQTNASASYFLLKMPLGFKIIISKALLVLIRDHFLLKFIWLDTFQLVIIAPTPYIGWIDLNLFVLVHVPNKG